MNGLAKKNKYVTSSSKFWSVETCEASIDEGWTITQGPSSLKFYVAHDKCGDRDKGITFIQNDTTEVTCTVCSEVAPQSTVAFAKLLML